MRCDGWIWIGRTTASELLRRMVRLRSVDWSSAVPRQNLKRAAATLGEHVVVESPPTRDNSKRILKAIKPTSSHNNKRQQK